MKYHRVYGILFKVETEKTDGNLKSLVGYLPPWHSSTDTTSPRPGMRFFSGASRFGEIQWHDLPVAFRFQQLLFREPSMHPLIHSYMAMHRICGWLWGCVVWSSRRSDQKQPIKDKLDIKLAPVPLGWSGHTRSCDTSFNVIFEGWYGFIQTLQASTVFSKKPWHFTNFTHLPQLHPALLLLTSLNLRALSQCSCSGLWIHHRQMEVDG